ncbi:inositol-pentakisphosphate 2-kinase-domain-containing protein [Pseudomassariella vexata]|uniref:Inositol-pentakisphosphate 2-kinase n=1 Tax=Pseudomassariella vexata TaxID=1141098 RepID=A0A1Y2EDN9_9PEZI|nr:inositol-pentakisphosphate 2-kinase-domain-containing protein [Pseudomassariella vexata]ORY69527.1 inositol-pentakisphosphate 2-kinase-domain-containing protein [Pseudomassariella vexata]
MTLKTSRRQVLEDLWDLVGNRTSKTGTSPEMDKINVYLKKSKLRYFTEGRANVVFRVEDEQDGSFTGALLRVPKSTPGADPHSYKRLQDYREKYIEPAVGAQFLVPQFLIELTEEQAKDLSQKRDEKLDRNDGSIIPPGYAMLIQDMSQWPGSNQITLEFKPKWLAQSPIAPEDATRCRTCAREAHRNQVKLKEGKSFTPPVCPLGLLHPNPDIVTATIRDLAPSWSEDDQRRLKDAFTETKILETLRHHQVAGDEGRIMFEHPEKPEFGLAMTLRDCTCFVRLDKGTGKVEIKLADVDEKNWKSKQVYWQESHDMYVDGGFYHGREEPGMETHCKLKTE